MNLSRLIGWLPTRVPVPFGDGDKTSVTPTGGSSLERARRILGVVAGFRGRLCSRCCVMPNGTADRPQRGGAAGGEGRWK
jgi:hypothetical protein